MPENNGVLMEVKNLRKWFPVKNGFGEEKKYVKAVENVSLSIRRGETLGIVGESGCGKSTLARLILRLLDATEGEVFFRGQDITALSGEELRKVRRYMQMVFQDPYASLNPRMRVGKTLSEPFLIHEICSEKEAQKRAAELLETVGLSAESLRKYPHEFSGGQRQRICIARALAVHPDLIVCDECVSALDVSIQAQIINLLMKLQKDLGIAIVFISHDLRVVRHISSNVAVMYLGGIAEYGAVDKLFENPVHPYTRALMSAVPIADPFLERKNIRLQGEVPSPIDRPEGCSFCTRCMYAEDICRSREPERIYIDPDHYVCCHLADRLKMKR